MPVPGAICQSPGAAYKAAPGAYKYNNENETWLLEWICGNLHYIIFFTPQFAAQDIFLTYGLPKAVKMKLDSLNGNLHHHIFFYP